MENQRQVSMTIDDYESLPDSDCESSSESSSRRNRFRDFARNGMERLNENHSDCEVIKKSFTMGMGIGIEGIKVNVVAIHKNSYSGVMGQARLESFRIFAAATAVKRGGDANIKHAWYGGDRDEIVGIATHGFARCGGFEPGVSHGIGVHLSPVNFPFDCAIKSKEDEYRIRHILLCRVILGNAETIAAGSRRFQPSSPDFDSGIDNPESPRTYTIWSAYMNSHIFPNYIISFTTSPALTGRNLPNSPGVKLQTLMSVLSRFLHPSHMGLILRCYNDFREHKIDRRQLIRRLRSTVGDQLLTTVINLYRDQI